MTVEVRVVSRERGRLVVWGEAPLGFWARVECRGAEALLSALERAARERDPGLLEGLAELLEEWSAEGHVVRLVFRNGECVLRGSLGVVRLAERLLAERFGRLRRAL
uniref:Uncharacterized protein n=1 Tax=Thermofilum pendens TaxID=2269 RepID=A0A7J3X4N7_THEPE